MYDSQIPCTLDREGVGPEVAALIVAIRSLGFQELGGWATLIHHNPAFHPESFGHVLDAANVVHRINSLATSCSIQ